MPLPQFIHRISLLAAIGIAGSSCSLDTHNALDTMNGTMPAHHLPGDGFRNPPGSPTGTASVGDMVKFAVTQLFTTRAPEIPEGHLLNDSERAKQLAAAHNPSVTWLGHAAFIIRVGGKVILTDPFLSENAGPWGWGPKRFVAPALRVDELPRTDVLLVSHDHYDHLDAETIEAYAHRDHTQVIVPLGLGDFFTVRGYRKVLEQDWWDEWSTPGLTIRTLPAVHFSGRGLGDRGKTLWASYGIYSGDTDLWFSGDTARGEVFKEIGERAGPFDYALVPIGAYEPRVIMQNVHTTPEEAVAIAKAVAARKAIAMHWAKGTLPFF